MSPMGKSSAQIAIPAAMQLQDWRLPIDGYVLTAASAQRVRLVMAFTKGRGTLRCWSY